MFICLKFVYSKDPLYHIMPLKELRLVSIGIKVTILIVLTFKVGTADLFQFLQAAH